MFGGRWTPAGVRVVHAAGSIALAALEYLVHARSPPLDLVLAAIDVPGDAAIRRPEIADLPEEWASPLTSPNCQAWGAAWCRSGTELALAVPSVIVPEERNYVLNVAHPRMVDVQIKSIRRFTYDLRLISM